MIKAIHRAVSCAVCAAVVASQLVGCGGGATTQTSTAQIQAPSSPSDPRLTSVQSESSTRWGAAGASDQTYVSGLTISSDGGIWVTRVQTGLFGNSVLHKVGGNGSNPCGEAGRVTTELSDQFERQIAVKFPSPVRSGGFLSVGTGVAARFVVRFLESTCALDPDWGNQGWIAVPTNAGFLTHTGYGLKETPDGRYLVWFNYPGRTELRRLNGDGSWDSSFGSGGLLPMPAGFVMGGVTFDSNGDLVLVGAREITSFDKMAMMIRADPDGRLSQAFGTAGVKDISGIGSRMASIGEPLVDGDRVIVISNHQDSPALQDVWTTDSVIAAIDKWTGELVPGFGVNGVYRWDWGFNNINSVGSLEKNGRGGYTMAGHTMVSLLVGQSLALVDVTADGRPDEAVGYQGRRLVQPTGAAQLTSSLALSDGRRVLGAVDGQQAVVLTLAAGS